LDGQSGAKKLLAINFGGLGDEVLFLPTLQSIKLQHPAWHITLLTEPRGASIAQVTDLVDANITFDIKKRPLLPADYLQLVSLLRGGGYDVVLSSGSSPQVSMLLFLSGIKQRIGFDSGALSRLLLTNAVPLNRNQHAVYMYHDLVKGLNIAATAQPPAVITSAENLSGMQALLNSGSASTSTASGGTAAVRDKSPKVFIHPGTSKLAISKGLIKTWAADNWAWLIGQLLKKDLTVVLAGGPDDDEVIKQIESALSKDYAELLAEKSTNFINAFGKTKSVKDLVALIDLCDLIVCVDSAPMHLAVGLNKRIVALFGPTDPERLLIKNPRFIAIRDENASNTVAFGSANFKQRQNLQSHSAADVQIPRDIVFRTAMDQLVSSSAPGN
jgi:ADP-heptose:LPS heptosyltransferase